jgi:hypothetical protein
MLQSVSSLGVVVGACVGRFQHLVQLLPNGKVSLPTHFSRLKDAML